MASTSPTRGPEIVTFGCRLNAYESEVIRELTEGAGLEGAVILNTCAVTNEATRQARQAIRKIARERPGTPIIVTGCGAQIEPDAFAGLAGVTRVIGNAEKLRRETWTTAGALARPEAKITVGDIMRVQENAPHLIAAFQERARAYVEVQNGCDHRCTFCIIPYGRGPSRSVPIEGVVAQVRALVGAGYKEIVLTGVDLTSWGADIEGWPSFASLVRAILQGVPTLNRLRLSSVDPAEVDDELIALYAGEERLMPYAHLSLQSGDDMILKRMKRRHSRGDAIALTERLRDARPGIVFGADLIAGFPTETDEMHAESLSAIDACALTFLHVFPYSAKAGTPAARMPQVERATAKARASALREKGAAALRAHVAGLVGHEGELLMEKEGVGRLPGFTPAKLEGAGVQTGDLVRVRITGYDGEHALAERLA